MLAAEEQTAKEVAAALPIELCLQPAPPARLRFRRALQTVAWDS
jgi:hypothetical protein